MKTNNLLSFDEKGLRRNLSYTFNDNGTIDWSRLIESKYIVPNRTLFEKRNKEVPISTEGLDDKEKLVLLAGYKNLLFLRGYRSVEYFPIGFNNEEVSVSCRIVFRGNLETGMEDVVYSSIGNASLKNTDGIFAKFLSPIAENRSLIRCVRNFLNIPILGQDELGPEEKRSNGESFSILKNVSPTHPHSVLARRLQEKNKTWDQLKTYLIGSCGYKTEQINSWSILTDIPVKEIPKILGILS